MESFLADPCEPLVLKQYSQDTLLPPAQKYIYTGWHGLDDDHKKVVVQDPYVGVA